MNDEKPPRIIDYIGLLHPMGTTSTVNREEDQGLFPHQIEIMQRLREMTKDRAMSFAHIRSAHEPAPMFIAHSGDMFRTSLEKSAFLSGLGGKSGISLSMLIEKTRKSSPWEVDVKPYSELIIDEASLHEMLAHRVIGGQTFTHGGRLPGKKYLEYIGRPPTKSKLAVWFNYNPPAAVSAVATIAHDIFVLKEAAMFFKVNISKRKRFDLDFEDMVLRP